MRVIRWGYASTIRNNTIRFSKCYQTMEIRSEKYHQKELLLSDFDKRSENKFELPSECYKTIRKTQIRSGLFWWDLHQWFSWVSRTSSLKPWFYSVNFYLVFARQTSIGKWTYILLSKPLVIAKQSGKTKVLRNGGQILLQRSLRV